MGGGEKLEEGECSGEGWQGGREGVSGRFRLLRSENKRSRLKQG